MSKRVLKIIRLYGVNFPWLFGLEKPLIVVESHIITIKSSQAQKSTFLCGLKKLSNGFHFWVAYYNLERTSVELQQKYRLDTFNRFHDWLMSSVVTLGGLRSNARIDK